MKLAIIHNQFTGGGGMESYLQSLLRGFINAGDEVHIYTYEVDKRIADRFPVTVHKRNLVFWPRRMRKYIFLYLLNREFQKKTYDLSLSLTRTNCQDMAIVGGVHPASVVSRRSQNWYRTLHDKVENSFERKMMSTCPCIVAHSNLIQREILKYYPLAEGKIRVIYPPIDTGRFQPATDAAVKNIRQQYGLDGRFTLLFPSLDHERKGLPELIKGLGLLNPERYCLLIAGRKPNRGSKLPLNVRYIGYVEDLSDLYSAVDGVILPSRYEPFGLVVAEALQCGTPAIVTARVGAAELMRKEEGIILSEATAEFIAEAVSGLSGKKVQPGFAERNGLEIDQHISALKQAGQMA